MCCFSSCPQDSGISPHFFKTVFVFQCQETNNTLFVREWQPVCDLQAMEKKFKAGGYTSIVSNCSSFQQYWIGIVMISVMSNNHYFLSLKVCSLWSILWIEALTSFSFCLCVLLESVPCRYCLCDEKVAEGGGAYPWVSETDQSGQGTLCQSEHPYPPKSPTVYFKRPMFHWFLQKINFFLP